MAGQLPLASFTRARHIQQRLANVLKQLETLQHRFKTTTIREDLAVITEEFQMFEATISRELKRPSQTLQTYCAQIDQFNASQPNRELLDAIRQYNHTIIDTLHQIQPLTDLWLLDVGASPHGYALERALAHGVQRYVGVGLDVSDQSLVWAPNGLGELVTGDAERLTFADETFEAVVSMSTFEHILHVEGALSEIRRVAKKGAHVLITFEPLWTSSYGHHLHHFGPTSRLMPDWAHLVWSKRTMLQELDGQWPDDAPLSLEEAATWVYERDVLNRIGIRDMRELLTGSGLSVEWIMPLADDEPRDPHWLELAMRSTGLNRDELTTKGFSTLLRR